MFSVSARAALVVGLVDLRVVGVAGDRHREVARERRAPRSRLRFGSSRTARSCPSAALGLAELGVLRRLRRGGRSRARAACAGRRARPAASSSSGISIGGCAAARPVAAPASAAAIWQIARAGDARAGRRGRSTNTPARAFASTAAPTRGGRSVRFAAADAFGAKRNGRTGTSDAVALLAASGEGDAGQSSRLAALLRARRARAGERGAQEGAGTDPDPLRPGHARRPARPRSR